ncbi:MAG: HAD-IA family hydrolase [Pirellulales bacterium]
MPNLSARFSAEPETGRRFPPEGVQTVVFDVVGTLVEPWPPVAEAYAAAGQRHGAVVAVPEIHRRFRQAWRRQELIDAAAVPAFTTSRSREADRWRAIVADVFVDHERTDAIFGELWDHFGRPDSWRPLAAGSALMQAAIASGASVALAINFDERLMMIAPAVAPLAWAEHVFASSEIGWRKPAPEFFRWIENRLGVAPEGLLLVGDDPELDIAAATRAGWQSRAVG